MRRLAIVSAIACIAVVVLGARIASTSPADSYSLPDDPTLRSCPRLGSPALADTLRAAGLPDAFVPRALVSNAKITGVRCATHSEFGLVGVTFMFTPNENEFDEIEVVLAGETPVRDAFLLARKSEISDAGRVRGGSIRFIEGEVFGGLAGRLIVGSSATTAATRGLVAAAGKGGPMDSIGEARWHPSAMGEVTGDD
jgi:hypothetical protein